MQPNFNGNMQNFNWMFGINPLIMNSMFNNQMGGINFWQNENWGMVYGNGININKDNQFNQNSPGKKNIIFKTTQNVKTLLTVDLNKTLSDTIL